MRAVDARKQKRGKKRPFAPSRIYVFARVAARRCVVLNRKNIECIDRRCLISLDLLARFPYIHSTAHTAISSLAIYPFISTLAWNMCSNSEGTVHFLVYLFCQRFQISETAISTLINENQTTAFSSQHTLSYNLWVANKNEQGALVATPHPAALRQISSFKCAPRLEEPERNANSRKHADFEVNFAEPHLEGHVVLHRRQFRINAHGDANAQKFKGGRVFRTQRIHINGLRHLARVGVLVRGANRTRLQVRAAPCFP